MKEVKIRIPTIDDILPKGFMDHMANAYKELLLALRCLIDERIKKIDEMKEKKIKKIEIQ